MNINKNIMIISLLLIFVSVATAQMVTKDDALKVANNWITFIRYNKGSWGDYETSSVKEVAEFKSDRRLLGYVCSVEPAGFIIVSLHRGLTPIKAYSTSGHIDTTAKEGLVDMVKLTMRRSLDIIEKQFGSIESVQPIDIRALTKVNHEPTWLALQTDVESFAEGLDSQVIAMDYVEGRELLTSDWHQQPPYNNDCPSMGCSWSGYGNYNNNALVGCIATAGAQVMRYWAWPPRGEDAPYDDAYDWENMLDKYEWDRGENRFEDDEGNPCSQAQINAVAELCAEVGEASGMNYGCDGSAAWMGDCLLCADLAHAFKQHFRYHSDLDFDHRWDNTNNQWHNKIMEDLDKNRPIPYALLDFDKGIAAHAIVIHGWEIDGSLFMCAINYGWDGTGDDIWYDIDDDLYIDSNHQVAAIFQGMIVGARPNVSLGSSLNGYYAKASFPYRYFDQDATGGLVIFEAGQKLQFLPGITVTATAETGIQILGESGDTTRLFSVKGTSSGGKVGEAKIYDGEIRLYNGGSIRFH